MRISSLLCSLLVGSQWVLAGETPMPPEHHHGAAVAVAAIESPTAIRYYLPDLSYQVLESDKPPRIGLEGYYALLQERVDDNRVHSQLRYFYKNGRPFSSKPKALFTLQKTALEIEPYPHPAEHNAYYSRKTWKFLVRFNGVPLVNTPVAFETENTTTAGFITDDNGLIAVTLPDDFSDIKPGHLANTPATFSLTATTVQGDKQYVSRLVDTYHVSTFHWQTVGGGLGVMVLGLVLGGIASTQLKSKPLKAKKYQERKV